MLRFLFLETWLHNLVATLCTRNAGNTNWRKRTLNPFQSYWNLASITSGGLCTDKAEDSQLLLRGHCGSILRLLTYSQTGQDMSRLKILFCGFERFRTVSTPTLTFPGDTALTRWWWWWWWWQWWSWLRAFCKAAATECWEHLGTLHWWKQWKSHKVSISIKYFLLLEGSRFLNPFLIRSFSNDIRLF